MSLQDSMKDYASQLLVALVPKSQKMSGGMRDQRTNLSH